MENPVKNLIEIIKTGSREEVKQAQKQVEKFWHNVYIPKREEGRKAFSVFLEEMRKFDDIKDIDHQAYFINTLKWPLYAIGEEYFEQWADFILKYIQHPSGKIRQAILHAAEYLTLDITANLNFFGNKKTSQNDTERMRKNKVRFCRFVDSATELLEKYREPQFNRYKFISSMPPGVYKSLQKLVVEVLLRSEAMENIYLEYQYEKHKQSPDEFNLPGLKLVQNEKEWDYYYDAMEYLNLGDTKMAEMLLQKAIQIDKNFVAGYVGMSAVFEEDGDSEQEKKYTNLAYEKTKKFFPKWPEEMPWGILENRQYLRAICGKAILCQEEGNLQEAEFLYRLLLKLNPNDNQGVRYLLAGMFSGLRPEDIDKLFDEGNKLQNWNKLKELVIEQNRKHLFWKEPKF